MEDGTLRIDDMEMTGEQLSMALIALDEFDLLKINDFNGRNGYGTCSMVTEFVDIERDEDSEFMQMTISRVSGIPHRGIEEEMLLDYPGELKDIPGFDYEKFCRHMFEDSDPWHFSIDIDYRLTEALYEFSEISGPYKEDSVPENVNVRKVVLETADDNYDVTGMLNEDATNMLFEMCRDYMESNSEFIND